MRTQVEINTQTYNVVSEDNKLLIRNAIDDIPKVSFLLSHIDIKVGDILDIGDQGLYTVKGGDTMSQVAEAHGMTTQALLKLNTWLIDEGKVHFDQDKVLVETDASNLTNKDHVYQGTSAEDRLIDKNGGFDTYIAGNGDTIIDSDGQGLINFNGVDLSGAKTLVEDQENLYEDLDFTYEETSSGSLVITAKESGESITVENWSKVVKTTKKSKEALGIKLSEGGDIEVTTESNSALEAQEWMSIPVALDRVVGHGEELVVQIGYYYNITQHIPVGDPCWVSRWQHCGVWYGGYWKQPTKTIVIGQEFVSYGTVTFTTGEQEKEFIYRWQDNRDKQSDRSYPMIPRLVEEASTYNQANVAIQTGTYGTGTIIDDDEPRRYDPLVLDTNKDGFITTTPLSESTTYFDITNIFTCKYFHTNKSLHVRNENQTKRSKA